MVTNHLLILFYFCIILSIPLLDYVWPVSSSCCDPHGNKYGVPSLLHHFDHLVSMTTHTHGMISKPITPTSISDLITSSKTPSSPYVNLFSSFLQRQIKFISLKLLSYQVSSSSTNQSDLVGNYNKHEHMLGSQHNGTVNSVCWHSKINYIQISSNENCHKYYWGKLWI